MTTFFWEPMQGLETIRREMEQLLQQVASPRRRSAFLPGTSARTYPLINISEDQDNVIVKALAPGLNPESIEVTVLRDTLRITGEKVAVTPDVKKEAFHRNERSTGSFTRVIDLPAEVDSNKVSAEYKNGLLLLTLPKHPESKPKQITVKVA
ncbi:MAG: Hsp20/alpha crystallin family protein [Candidatus Hydrogenedentes bacterium]|nr:Hsp20/alpha crystallin family protein [Candidatus Hydrogenedentota bacterium]